MKIILASGNQGKIREIKKLLTDLPIEFISQSEFNVSEAEETGTTFIENALIKARHAAAETGMPAMADDSGLSIDALNGAPGVYSARYAGESANDHDRIQKVLKELTDVPAEKRGAQFHCAIAFVKSADDPNPIVCEGIWPGIILNEPRGDKGFGYDPIFFVPEKNCSAAELDPDLKNEMSHRGRAMREFRTLLITEIA